MCDGGRGCGTEEEGGDRPYLPQQTTAQLIRFKPQPFQHPFPSSSPFLKLSFCLNQMVFILRPLSRFCLCTLQQGLCCFLARVTGLVSTGGVVSCSNSALLLPLSPTLPPGGAEELSQRHLRCPSRDSLQTARSLKQYINETTDVGKADMDQIPNSQPWHTICITMKRSSAQLFLTQIPGLGSTP